MLHPCGGAFFFWSLYTIPLGIILSRVVVSLFKALRFKYCQ
jgi:hypothetical protein